MKITFLQDQVFALESPVSVIAGESITFSCTYPFATTVAAPASVKVYRGSSDVSATIMPSGSNTASGNVVTTKPATALTGGNVYIVSIVAVIDSGDSREKKIMLMCQKAEGKQ